MTREPTKTSNDPRAFLSLSHARTASDVWSHLRQGHEQLHRRRRDDRRHGPTRSSRAGSSSNLTPHFRCRQNEARRPAALLGAAPSDGARSATAATSGAPARRQMQLDALVCKKKEYLAHIYGSRDDVDAYNDICVERLLMEVLQFSLVRD